MGKYNPTTLGGRALAYEFEGDTIQPIEVGFKLFNKNLKQQQQQQQESDFQAVKEFLLAQLSPQGRK